MSSLQHNIIVAAPFIKRKRQINLLSPLKAGVALSCGGNRSVPWLGHMLTSPRLPDLQVEHGYSICAFFLRDRLKPRVRFTIQLKTVFMEEP